MPRVRLLGPALVVLAAFAALIVSLELGGGAAALPIADPGASVRYGIPVMRLVQDLAVAATIGGLVFACFALKPGTAAWNRALDIAAAASGVATVACGAVAFLQFRSLVTSPLSVEASFTSAFLQFFTQIEAGQLLLATVVAFAILTTLLLIVRSATGVAWLVVTSAVPLAIMAEMGHSGGTESHTIAVSGLWLHLLFASIWLGGLVHLAVLRITTSPSFADALRRYSTLAIVSFAVVAFSGVVSAWVRIGADGLATPYAALVFVKTALLVALGAIGAWQRMRFVRRQDAGAEPRVRWLFAAELAVMGLAMGVANGLARTPTPVLEQPAGDGAAPSRILTGKPLPPPFDASRLVTEWSIDPLWTVICVMLLGFYLAGVRRLARRGDRWPWVRTVSWSAGVVLLWWCTNGALNAYQEFSFSLHMLVHMLLGMAVPVLLVPGAPVTLGMRAIAKRTDGTMGGREWLLAIVHSRWMGVISRPLVATAIFVASLWLFYFTPVFGWAMSTHLGHIWMVVHFVGAGYLFVQALVGIDPGPERPPYALRLVMLLSAMVFHAFFGLTIMISESLLLADWFGAMGNGVDALADQRVGGGIAWGIGELPTLVLAIVLTILWSRSDEKLARRMDRAAERDGDAERTAYNEMLERMAKR